MPKLSPTKTSSSSAVDPPNAFNVQLPLLKSAHVYTVSDGKCQ